MSSNSPSGPVTPEIDVTPPSKARPETLRAFCERILMSGDLATKLTPPPSGEKGFALSDTPSGPPILIDRPARDPGLQMNAGSDRLPRPGMLRERKHRQHCLARFAHHELQAVEYFAWALLRWPELPSELRRGLLAALVDEQRHCRLYLERLKAEGGRFDSDDHSDYFWRQAPAIAASPAGPRAFLAVMGLTLEQANLDFTLTYRDGFREAGEHESAALCQLVHDEEIGHVALAARWLPKLAAAENQSELPATGEVESEDLRAYLEAVPFPMGPARAKGRRFEVAPRRRAGLSEAMIDHVRSARSTQELAKAGDRIDNRRPERDGSTKRPSSR